MANSVNSMPAVVLEEPLKGHALSNDALFLVTFDRHNKITVFYLDHWVRRLVQIGGKEESQPEEKEEKEKVEKVSAKGENNAEMFGNLFEEEKEKEEEMQANMELVEQILLMGFSLEQAKRAVIKTENKGVAEALEVMIIEGGEQPEQPEQP